MPAEHEHATLLKNLDGPLRIVLTIGSRAGWGPFTLLHVEFREAASPNHVISSRVLASCHGILTAEGGTRHSADDLTRSLDQAVKLDNDHTGSDGALQLASYWIQSCVGTHSKCQRALPEDMTPSMPTRLLGVADNKIKLIDSKRDMEGTDRRYLALSHCWGPVPIIRTMRNKYNKHSDQILPEELSKTFGEAIQVTRKLGFRYI